MISCDIIRDLLLLYTSDECSEDSKKLIEEHIKTCEGCRKALEELRGPVIPLEELETRTALEEKAKDFKVTRVFKKIRRRWLASLLCVLLLFPLVGTGFMVRNQIEGEGICFTNLDELYTAYAFLRAVEKGDYEKAFSYIDTEGMYKEITEGQLEGFTDWDAKYTEAEIGGKIYYVNQQVYQNDYQWYLEDGDEAQFWESMMIDNSEHSSSTPIPEKIFAEAAALFEEETGIVISTDQTVGDVLDDNPEYDVYGHCYTAVTSGEGDVYYFLPYMTELEYPQIFSNSYCLPKAVFEQFRDETKEDYTQISACADYYRDMGLETYTQLLKEEFLANMAQLEEEGITVKASSLVQAYYAEGEWRFDIRLICSQNGQSSSTGAVGIDAKGALLRVSGGISASDVNSGIYTAACEWLYLGEDPAGYYLAHPYNHD